MAIAAGKSWWLALLLFWSLILVRAQDGPKVAKKEFDLPAGYVEYFEDSDTIILGTDDIERNKFKTLWRSENAGQTWEELQDIKDATQIILHPYDNQIAFALTQGRRYWVTHDQGKKWKGHDLPEDVQPLPREMGREVLNFNARDKKKVIFNAVRRTEGQYEEQAYYSKDGFDKPGHLKILREDVRGCSWADSRKEFKPLEDHHAKNRILCLAKGKFSSFLFDQRLLISDNYFKKEKEPSMSSGRTMQGIISIAHIKGYIVAAARAENTRELAMFISVDGLTWHRAEFETDHKLEERSYTVLESTNYSLQVAVTTSPRTSILMTSNSNGTYFSANLDGLSRDPFYYFVDFEKVMGFQGVMLANVIGEDGIITRINFRDGQKDSWKSLKAGEEEFHLHSVTDKRNIGRVYSSGAPGVLMGIGNTGERLREYEEGDLFVSNDAGHNWEHTESVKGPHKYAFGDQGNVLIAIPDNTAGKIAKYSLNHGKDWTEFTIDDDSDVRVDAILTSQDSTSRVFFIIGNTQKEGVLRQVIYSVDMDALLPDTCQEEDLEDFTALEDYCVMGHKQIYRRRKREAKCFIRSNFKEEEPRIETCTCTEDDFECDFDFVPQNGKCIPASMKMPEGQCRDKGDTFRSKSGFRIVPGNDCKREGGTNLDNEIDRSCNETLPEVETNIDVTASEFEGSTIISGLVYLERTKTSGGNDETVVALVGTREDSHVYISFDHGKNWKLERFEGDKIVQVVAHKYDNDAVFFLTNSKKVWVSYNRCKSFSSFEVKYPYIPEQVSPFPLSFHQDYTDMFIWTGASSDCKSGGSDCHFVSQYTGDRGDSWTTLARYTSKCEFIKREGRNSKENSTQLIYCGVHNDEDVKADSQLVRSDNFFESREIIFDRIVDFEITSEFVVSAGMDTDGLLFVNASIAGGEFAAAKFPPQFSTTHKTFTVLQSETHAILLYALVSASEGFEYGRILKSNSNGTFYVSSLDGVSSDKDGFVDFEKVHGLEGVSLANVVVNQDEAGDSRLQKKLQTRITHNDGADWAPLPLPSSGKDSEGHNYDRVCRNKGKCSLNLFGFTEKVQPYSSSSAVALIMGNGNVGEFLDTSGEDTALFVSNDAGLSWNEVRKGQHQWTYVDQGSILVAVQDDKPTNQFYFSDNEGQEWKNGTFSEEPVRIIDITTLPSDNSKVVLIWVKTDSGITSYRIDFSGLREKECKLNDADPDDPESDYYSWSPKHPFQKDQDCLFGHVAVYHRKKAESSCWNGQLIDSHGLHDISRNCPCIKQDFECDFNYEKTNSGECELVPGFARPDHSQQCLDNESLEVYYTPTGYRRIPLDTCEGGLDLEYREGHDCPGHEGAYERLRGGLSGFALFFVAIVLPLCIAGTIGYVVYRRWDGKLGAIRLGESPADAVLDVDKPWIKFPIMTASALVAVAMALPGIVATIWRSASSVLGRRSGRYTTRDSFSRLRGEYTIVEDEDELLGEDEDEEL